MTKKKDFDAYLSSLYTEYYDELLKWCHKQINYRPEMTALLEEWIHETFVRAMKNPKKIRDHAYPIAWLKTTCGHIMGDYFRHQQRKKEKFGTAAVPDSLLQFKDTEDRMEKWAQHYDDQQLLAEILALLTDSEQAVFQRYFVKGMHIADVANELQKKPGAVKDTIQRIREKARAQQKKTAK